jgi:magnesium transporter
MDRVGRPLIEEVMEDLLPLVEARQDGAIKTVLVNLHPADIAVLIGSLGDDDEERYVFGLLRDPEIASDVLTELPPPVREHVISELPHEELADLVEEMESDDAADLVQGLPDELASRVLMGIEPEDLAEIRPLLGHDEDTAGGIMATELLTVNVKDRVLDAREALRARSDEVENFYYIFVVDDEGRLKGTLTLTDLVLRHSNTPVIEAMDSDPVWVPPEMDQEQVADIVRRYDLYSVPVVDAAGVLLGRITVDDVVDVMREEAEENMARMAGTVEQEFDESSVRRIAFLRLPWLITSLFGGLLAGAVLRHFAGSLQGVIVFLVVFVPVITAMGGNAGSQAAVTMVRRLAIHPVRTPEFMGIVFREARVGLLLGLMCGVIVGAVAFVWLGEWYYGTVVGVAMISAVLVAATMGSVVPMVFHRLQVDPAIATGPFVSMSNDVVGLFIYFGLATLLLQISGLPVR